MRHWPTFVLLVAIAFRIALLSQAVPAVVSDATDYRLISQSLLDDGEYAYRIDDPSSPMNGVTLRAYRPPGYPVFRSAVMLISGRSEYAVMYANGLLECLALVLFGRVTHRLAGDAVGAIGSFYLAVFLVWTSSLMTESLSLFLWGLVCWLAFDTPPKFRGLFLGIALGGAVLTRPTAVALVVLLPFARLSRREWATVASSLTLVVGAWVLRNYWVIGTPTFSTNAGLHSAVDLQLGSLQEWGSMNAAGVSEAEINSEFARRVAAHIQDQPTAFGARFGERLLSFLDPTREDCFELFVMREMTFRASPDVWRVASQVLVVAPAIYVSGWLGLIWGSWKGNAGARAFLAISVAFAVLHCAASRVDIRLVSAVFPLLAFGSAYLVVHVPAEFARLRTLRRSA